MSHITLGELPELKEAYNQAVADGVDMFLLGDRELYTPYAKYLIEYMETLWEKSSQ